LSHLALEGQCGEFRGRLGCSFGPEPLPVVCDPVGENSSVSPITSGWVAIFTAMGVVIGVIGWVPGLG
jgi:hypothetical protein